MLILNDIIYPVTCVEQTEHSNNRVYVTTELQLQQPTKNQPMF